VAIRIGGQRGDGHATATLQQGQIPPGTAGFVQRDRWQAAVLRPSPIPGLASDTEPLARLHGSHTRQYSDSTPNLRLGPRLPINTPQMIKECRDKI
jgi:hypothetical protein